MSNNVNQTTPKIYYRPLHKWLEVTLEKKQNWERFTNSIRKAQQRAGAYCISYKKSYKCDGLCDGCEFRYIPEDIPQQLSIDAEMENTYKNGISHASFLADDSLTTEINTDSTILKMLLTKLRDTDPESYRILMVVAEGLSERAGAERLHMPRNTFVYKKKRLLKLLSKNF